MPNADQDAEKLGKLDLLRGMNGKWHKLSETQTDGFTCLTGRSAQENNLRLHTRVHTVVHSSFL